MQGSMSNGVSALLSFQKAMEVEAHNTGNVKTTAYKADQVSFSDMFYQDRVGRGVDMDTPRKDFSQGQLVPTNSEYDFAIDGEGFFTVQDPRQPDNIYYTRAGQFKNSKDNMLVDANGMLVMGIKPTVSGDIITSAHTQSIATSIVKTEESTAAINTYTSDYQKSAKVAGDMGVNGEHYKTAGTTITDIENLIYEYNKALKNFELNPIEGEDVATAQSSVRFPLGADTSEKYIVEIEVNGVKFQQGYEDSVENTLKLFSDKINTYAGITSIVDETTGELTISSMIPGNSLSVTKAKLNDNNLAIDELSSSSGSGQKLIDAIYEQIQVLFERVNTTLETNNALKPDEEKLDAESLESFKAIIATNKSEIPNLESGAIGNFEAIELDLNALGMNSTLAEKLLADGDVKKIAAYPTITSDNGRLYMAEGDARFLVGLIAPVTFTDKTILSPQGDNLYSNTDTDVAPYFIKNSATVHGKYYEQSNVDLSKELVNLLTFQKAFEANSKSISTSDEMMKTALALKTK